MIIDGKNITVVGMVRSKNSAKYLPRLFTQLNKICDKILITDNESADNTVQIVNTYPKVVRFPTLGFDGGRDWRLMWKAAEPFNPTWIIGIDSDELFEEGKEQELLNLIANTDPETEAWSFPFLTCWNSEDTYNTDGWYNNARVIRLFRYSGKLPKNTARHSTSCPEGIQIIENCDNIRVKHFGYMTREDRLEKHNHYCNRDTDMIAKGVANYDHFKPDALGILRSWNDWKPLLKLQFGNTPLKPGGYFKVKDNMTIQNNVDYIYADNFFEYVGDSYVEVIKKFFEILKEECKLEVRVEDFRRLCLEYIKSDVAEVRLELMKEFYSGRSMGFDYESIKKALELNGFVNVQRIDGRVVHLICNKPKK